MSNIKNLKDRLLSIEEGTFRNPLDVVPLEPGAGAGSDSPAGALVGAAARNPNLWRSARRDVTSNPVYTGAGNLPVRQAQPPVEPTLNLPPLAPLPKPRIKLQSGETPAQAIERIRRTAPTLTDRVPEKDPVTGRIEPTLEDDTNKFPGYWRGTDNAKAARSKMVGMEESIERRAKMLMANYQRFKSE